MKSPVGTATYKPYIVVCWWHEKPVHLGQYATMAEAAQAGQKHDAEHQGMGQIDDYLPWKQDHAGASTAPVTIHGRCARP